MNASTQNTQWLLYSGIVMGLFAILLSMLYYGLSVGFAIACIPFVTLYLLLVLKNPYWGLFSLFIANYFLIPIIRYSKTEGLSMTIDILILFTLVSLFTSTFLAGNIKWNYSKNKLTLVAFIWLIYCGLEFFNPTSLPKAWILSRGLIYYFVIISIFTTVIFNQYRDIKRVLYLWAFFTILAVGKSIWQHSVGFDNTELGWLHAEGYRTHLLNTGTRYFSFFTDAGNFGSNMGFALVVFSIAAITIKNSWIRTFFAITALLAAYGMIISGTRGALAVPFAGFTLYLILSKKAHIFFSGLIILAIIFVFFTFTDIGSGNQYIRRTRTAFDRNEPSLLVRLNNQKILGEYLQTRPFGEGLGLSGVEAKQQSARFTTSIPTDSWYVKIWVETGIVGLCLHIAILLFIVLYGAYTIMYKIKDRELKGILSALLCGIFGIMISSYGNSVFGQYPTAILLYMSMAFIFMGVHFDKNIELDNTNKEQNNIKIC